MKAYLIHRNYAGNFRHEAVVVYRTFYNLDNHQARFLMLNI